MDHVMVLGVTHQGKRRGGSCRLRRAAVPCVALLAACANTASGTNSVLDASVTPVDAAHTPDVGRSPLPDVGGAVFDVNGPPSVAPRQIAPLSTSTVTSTRPTLEWRRPVGVLRTRIEICAEPSCRYTEAVIESTAESARPPSSLSPGIHFWRVIALNEDGSSPRPSHVWWFRSPAADTMTDTSHGLSLDYNGDGYGDLALLIHTNTNTNGRFVHGRPAVLLGGPDGISAASDRRLDLGENVPIYRSRFSPNPSVRIAHIGDLNGDGLSDLLLKHIDESDRMNLRLYYGSRSGVGQIVLLRTSEGEVDWGDIYPIPVGDFNRDGFIDLAAIHAMRDVQAMQVVSVVNSFFMGGPRGPEYVRYLLPRPHRAVNWYVIPGGDMNGDRRTEFVLYSDERRIFLVDFEGAQFNVQELSTPEYGTDRDIFTFTPACDINGDGYSDFVQTHSLPYPEGTERLSTIIFGSGGEFRPVDIELLRSRRMYCNSVGLDGRSNLLSVGFSNLYSAGFPAWIEKRINDSPRASASNVPGTMTLGNDYDRNGMADIAIRDPAGDGLRAIEVFLARPTRWDRIAIEFDTVVRVVE